MSSDGVNNAWRAAQDSVIGSMLIDPECVPSVLMATEAGDFEDFNQAAWNVIRRLNAENRPVDAVTVLDAMGSEYRERIWRVMKTTPTSANVTEYVKIVREQSRLSALRKLSYELASAVDMDTARELVTKAQALTVDRRGVDVRTWAQMIEMFTEKRRDDRPQNFLDWGVPALNETLHVNGGMYILLGGEASSGKSAMMFQLAQYMSKTHRVGIFSFETDEDEMSERMASNLSQVSFTNIIRNRLNLVAWQKLNAAFASTYGNALEALNASGMTAEDIAGVTRARRYEVIFIDYVQLVTPSGNARDIREQQVAKISRALQGLAKEKPGVTVVGLSQLSRPDTDKAGNSKEPGMHDFRESGQLEQDADVAMILYKPFPKAADYSDRGKLRRLSIVKNKRDSLAKLNFRFDGEYQTFRYITPSDAKRIENEEQLEEPSSDNPYIQTELST